VYIGIAISTIINQIFIAMKNLTLFCLLFALTGLQSCKKNQEQNAEKTQIQPDKVVSSKCYKSIYEKDTIDLKVNTLENGKLSGNMVMKVFNEPKKTGKIAGEFHGDTLIAYYTFIMGANEKVTFKNPMAFLKRGDSLVLGNGKIQTTMGVSFFVKGAPIDYVRVKYKFATTDCPAK
jgi:hypothetical protein